MSTKIRAASPADATHVAALANMAGDGLPAFVWSMQADYGQDPLEQGRKQILAGQSLYNLAFTRIIEIDGAVAGMIATLPQDSEGQPVHSGLNPLLRPMIRLKNAAPDTLHINALAVYPDYQRHGLARRLLQDAERRPEKKGLSVILADANAAGLAFCASLGFQEVMRLPLVHGTWDTQSREWVLLTKPASDIRS